MNGKVLLTGHIFARWQSFWISQGQKQECPMAETESMHCIPVFTFCSWACHLSEGRVWWQRTVKWEQLKQLHGIAVSAWAAGPQESLRPRSLFPEYSLELGRGHQGRKELLIPCFPSLLSMQGWEAGSPGQRCRKSGRVRGLWHHCPPPSTGLCTPDSAVLDSLSCLPSWHRSRKRCSLSAAPSPWTLHSPCWFSHRASNLFFTSAAMLCSAYVLPFSPCLPLLQSNQSREPYGVWKTLGIPDHFVLIKPPGFLDWLVS